MSLSSTYISRDKRIAKETQKLFLRGWLQAPGMFALMFLYGPAFFLLHVYIPLHVAYSLQAIIAREFDKLDHHLVIIGIAGVAQLAIMALAAWSHNRNGIAANAFVQRHVFTNFLNKDYDFFSSQYLGSLSAQATSIRDAMSSYSQLMFNKLFKHGAIVFGGISVLLIKAPLLALIIVACMLLVLVYTFATSHYRLRYRRDVSEASSQLAGVISDAIGQAATVKSFASEDDETQRLNKTIDRWKIAQLKSWDLFVPVNSGRNLINFAVLIILIYVTAQMYESNTISVALVILVQLYMVRLIATIIDIADFVREYDEIMSRAHETVRTMHIPSHVNDAAVTTSFPATVQSITFQNVGFRYDVKHASYALKDVDFELKAGTKIGLVGYSGSGKTTLSKLLVRFIDTSRGSIKINGIDLRDMKQDELRKNISYVPQEPLLFHRSIYENSAYGRPNANKDEIFAAARSANIEEFIASLPHGYDTLVGERGIKLSGGQRQRIAIARAILKDAPILVLDEATSALDSKSEKLIQDALWNLMKGRTALVIAHRLSTIQRMDKIIVLDSGSVSEAGTHNALLEQDGVYAKLWKHQSGGYINEEQPLSP